MKKHLRLILIMVFAVTLTLVLSGCGKGSTDFEGKNVVTFDLCGGTMETKSATVKTQINFAYEPGTYILDPIETLKYTLNKPEYIFTGWYTSPECKSADKWDFGTLFETENLTLYAGWKKAIKYTYTVYYVENGVPVALNSCTVDEGAKLSDYNYNSMKTRVGYTSIERYSDPDFTTVWDKDFTHPGGDVDTDIPVYVKYVKGTFTVVNDYETLTKAIESGSNIYLNADIDCGGKVIARPAMVLQAYNRIFEGNNHTVSNFKVDKEVKSTAIKISIFETLGVDAEIRNVKFEGAIYDLSGVDTTKNIELSALANESEGAKITNVSVTGKVIVTTDVSIDNSKLNSAVYKADDQLVIELFTANITVETQN